MTLFPHLELAPHTNYRDLWKIKLVTRVPDPEPPGATARMVFEVLSEKLRITQQINEPTSAWLEFDFVADRPTMVESFFIEHDGVPRLMYDIEPRPHLLAGYHLTVQLNDVALAQRIRPE